jgi:hypothetical protein
MSDYESDKIDELYRANRRLALGLLIASVALLLSSVIHLLNWILL